MKQEAVSKPYCNQSQVEYLPPEREGIDRYALALCRDLADVCDDPSYRSDEVVRGLAEFLHLSGQIQAKHLNRGGGEGSLFDKAADRG